MGVEDMIPSWMRFRGDLLNGWEEDGEPDKKKTLKEQKAILKALADPVENDKFLYDSWRYKKEYKDES